ncbi:hypothetical protein STRIP9103_00677 [Streptomyces ipomoeae 91-03]|uniref:Uncharacterized protein n=1 Tax=Streptomyces ipomoeae 91-03 TaxID=698759 RepID=L1KKJ9_9ACTN|nr:hypothetical protein STRIP9103_00677 [Streptomyces ipomoeae 91-03]
MELSFCWSRRADALNRGRSRARTARTRRADQVHMDALDKKEFPGHTRQADDQ